MSSGLDKGSLINYIGRTLSGLHRISLTPSTRRSLNVHMDKTKTFAEENHQIIKNEVVRDDAGAVIFEEVTCETSTKLPALRLVDDELERLLKLA